MEITIEQVLILLGEKQVRLEMALALGRRLEQENAALRQTVDAQSAEITRLNEAQAKDVEPPEIDIEASRMEAGE